MEAADRTYHEDMWAKQQRRVFVIIEKDALVGILEPVCRSLDVPLLSAKGFSSETVLREFAKDQCMPALVSGQEVIVLNLADHDPSGIFMTRDLRKRINRFLYGHDRFDLQRIALNMDQIEELRLPENPAKKTDSRFKEYREEFKTESSWELDALHPEYLVQLVEHYISKFIDWGAWKVSEDVVNSVKDPIAASSKQQAASSKQQAASSKQQAANDFSQDEE